MVKLIFNAYKIKLIKYFIYNFLPIYKNVKKTLSEKTKKGFQKKLIKGTKIYLKKKKAKCTNVLLTI